ncbi:efflux RND transporter periplasmic adaptor subunit [Desulfosarcina sp.]|uniref:efflux RND transporter periplasmic adaptor subunit n=1 Tax=Desulfosarcina sp. TaxID=2027861 RepID=UPI0029B97515|nr:efflux RND transporter periplasmic adaptor subunit [Desulfosarcina sp.]MDX2454418.1 efflux RND transporter periplasmic adaptor subunit [Desulfosarcina sp.]
MNSPRATLTFIMAAALLFLMADHPARAETIEYEGLIEPYEVVEIGAPAEGIVAKVMVDRSSLVKRGQVLVELESSVERATLGKARTMATFDGEIDLQQAQLAFTKRVHQRVRQLAVISTQEKDQVATEIMLTGYRLKKARENHILAELEVDKMRAMLARRSIKSPISGVVVDRYVSPGEYVNNQPLLRVAQIDPLRVEVIVPAQMFGRIIPGMPAVIFPDLPRFGEQAATVTIVDNVIDSASNTFGVRLELPNAEQQMPSGLKCLVRFEVEEDADEAKKATGWVVRGHEGN